MTTLRLGGGLAGVWLAPRYAGLGAKDLFMLAFIGLGLLELMNLCLSWRRLGRRQSARHWMPTLATLSLIAGCLFSLWGPEALGGVNLFPVRGPEPHDGSCDRSLDVG
ncbi:MAG: hypothetical protein ACJAZN_002423 [Planctomycetota bacterium]|jgi:hypothetical protein